MKNTYVSMENSSVWQQLKRYSDEYGQGAVICTKGFSERLQKYNPDILVLDAGSLNVVMNKRNTKMDGSTYLKHIDQQFHRSV